MKENVKRKKPFVSRIVAFLLALAIMPGWTNEAFSQSETNVSLQGHVFDDQEPPMSLIGVLISVKNTNNATVSDDNGSFKISANKGDVLVFSLIGFIPQEYVVSRNETNLNISMKELVQALNEVVVTGMSEERKLNTISSIAKLDLSTNLENKPILSLSQALQGGITGLTVTQSSGLPGADAATIKIRGISTIGNSTDPLVLVDGIPMDMDNLDPTTIESVTILKDAAAAAIYGSRAANGVIIIKTKRGKAGKVRVTYNGYYGTQKATYLPEFVSASEYMDLANKAYANIGGDPVYSADAISKTASGSDPINYPNTNWKDIIYKDGNIQSHSVSVSGGSNVARFALTINNQHQEGLIKNTNFDRLNIRANTSVSLTEKLSVNMDFNSYRRERREAMYRTDEYSDRILRFMFTTPPNVVSRFPVKEEHENIVYYGNRMEMRNPAAIIDRGGFRAKLEDNVSINIQPRWTIVDGLTLRGQYSYRVSSGVEQLRRKSYNFFDYSSDALIYSWSAINTATKDRSSYYYLGGTLDYVFESAKHRVFTIVGYNQELTNSGDFDQYAMQSVYGKVNYTFNRRYMLEGTLRSDGSSRFAKGHKFGYFPSIGGGWNVHEEAFMKSLDFLNNFKLRASYGLLGNENIGLYKYQLLVDGNNGVEVVDKDGKYANPNITWETIHMFDVGADFTLFDKLTLTFDYYNKLTEGIIISPPVSLIGGLGSAPINSGEVQNRGWELDLNYNNRIGGVSYNIHGGISHNENKILSLFGGPYDNGTTIHKVGHALSSNYLYKTQGLLQESDFTGKDANGSWIPKPGVVIFDGQQPGDIHYVDMDKNNILDMDDRVVKGDGQPNLNYFINITLNYKKWSFETLLQGVTGVDAYYSDTYANGLSVEGDGSTPLKEHLNYWTPENTNARYPRIAPTSQYGNNHHLSDYWFFDAGFCRIKYLQLGYKFDQPVLKKAGISDVKVYVNAQNPFTFAKDKLVDPEARGSVTSYPLLRTFSVGLNLNF